MLLFCVRVLSWHFYCCNFFVLFGQFLRQPWNRKSFLYCPRRPISICPGTEAGRIENFTLPKKIKNSDKNALFWYYENFNHEVILLKWSLKADNLYLQRVCVLFLLLQTLLFPCFLLLLVLFFPMPQKLLLTSNDLELCTKSRNALKETCNGFFKNYHTQVKFIIQYIYYNNQ